jgi:hypothetical protein
MKRCLMRTPTDFSKPYGARFTDLTRQPPPPMMGTSAALSFASASPGFQQRYPGAAR